MPECCHGGYRQGDKQDLKSWGLSQVMVRFLYPPPMEASQIVASLSGPGKSVRVKSGESSILLASACPWCNGNIKVSKTLALSSILSGRANKNIYLGTDIDRTCCTVVY